MDEINTQNQIRKALKGLNDHALGYNHQDAQRDATANAVLALVAEQRITNSLLVSIAESLGRIAKAAQQPTASTPEPTTPEPKRRFWLPGRPAA